MKTFIILLTLTLANAATAQEMTCEIAGSNSCAEAVKLAETCRQGSSVDVDYAGAAQAVCVAQTGKLSQADRALLKKLQVRCTKAFLAVPRPGSIHRSILAFCHMSAVKFFHDLNNSQD
jgi:hypothetical protein